jgi:predicted Zn finger-like uncharacterized protein
MILNCPHCENEFYVPDELAGETVNCHKCKRPVLAPAKAKVPGEEAAIVTDFDLRHGAVAETKAEADTQTQTGTKMQTCNRITPRRGFRRLALLVSLILGPLVFIGLAIRSGYALGYYLIWVNSFFELLEGLSPTTRVLLEFVMLWAGGFAVVWAFYSLGSFIVSGFFETNCKTLPSLRLRSGLKAISGRAND